VGAHDGEEQPAYEAEGWGRVSTVWVEALPSKCRQLEDKWASRSNIHVVEGIAWHRSGETIPFNVMSNVQSSSALPPLEHLDIYPDIQVTERLDLATVRLDSMSPVTEMGRVNFICLDIQGSELHALEGLGSVLEITDAVYSEVSTRELYENGPTFVELDRWLSLKGLQLVDWQIHKEGWGDALWLRNAPRNSMCHVRRKLRQAHNKYRQLRRRVRP